MAIRTLLPIAVLALATLVCAKSSYFLDRPEIVEDRYDAGPLKCYSQNNVTGAVSLQICRLTTQDKDGNFVELAGYPACMMAKKRFGTMKQFCIYLPSVAITDCDEHLCMANKHADFSECCCTRSGCNGQMMKRPKAVVELPDEELNKF